jgi:pimeloyl-ACP methyl ester carboxylesterase
VEKNMPRIHLNGIDINYLDEGQGEGKPVLLMVHNLTSNIAGFKYNVGELSKHYRVVAADIRGHGLTTHEEDEEKAKAFYTFDNLANDQVALLDHLGIDKFYLFGQAYWGANTALHLFEKLSDRILGVVISSAYMIPSDDNVKPYEPLGEQGKKNFIRMHQIAREQGMMGVYNDRLTSGQFWGPRVLNSPDILAEFTTAHEQTSATAFVTLPHLPAPKRKAISDCLKRTGVPLMLLLGEDENPNGKLHFIEEMRKDYPATHVIVLPLAGHYPTIENPYDFNRALLNFYAGIAHHS